MVNKMSREHKFSYQIFYPLLLKDFQCTVRLYKVRLANFIDYLFIIIIVIFILFQEEISYNFLKRKIPFP